MVRIGLSVLAILITLLGNSYAQQEQKESVQPYHALGPRPLYPPPSRLFTERLTVTGKLDQIYMVGGETTGWVVHFDYPPYIWGEKLMQIEVDPGKGTGPTAPFCLEPRFIELRGKHIEIVGYIDRRRGVERSFYWVLEAKEIRERKDAWVLWEKIGEGEILSSWKWKIVGDQIFDTEEECIKQKRDFCENWGEIYTNPNDVEYAIVTSPNQVFLRLKDGGSISIELHCLPNRADPRK